jgi:tetratricopeptide (TPR) repeat protein/predicted aspartyl protease
MPNAHSGWIWVAAGLLALVPVHARAAQAKCSLRAFTMPVTMEGLRASVPVKVNGVETDFWIDSGAWFSIMSKAKADELSLRLRNAPGYLRLEGIGGSFSAQVATIKDFAVVGAALHDVDFIVGGSDAGNGLIGRNLLTAFDTEFDLAHGELKLDSAQNCQNTNMAYWANDKPFFTVRLLPDKQGELIKDFQLPVLLNGIEVHAEIDSGAVTLISRRAAERAGIDLKAPGIKPVNGLRGFGRHFQQGWIVPFKSVDIGDEKILNPKLTVIDGGITDAADGPDMLLGIDFLLAHHLYVSRAQHLIYFTYSGGDPFVTDAASARPHDPATTRPPAIPPGTHLVQAVNERPQSQSAGDLAREGAARLALKDTTGAIEDFSRAIDLAPDNASYYKQRAVARMSAGDQLGARNDLNQAIEHAPKDPDLRLFRAEVRHLDKDDSGAWADAAAAKALIPPQSLDIAAVAALYDELGHAGDAVPLFGDVIAAHRDDSRLGSLLNGRCWSRALAGVELDDALADCNRALKLTGKASAVLDSRALVQFRRKDYAAALADYDAVLKEDPKAAWSLYMRGKTLIALGQADKGQADRKAALTLDPDVQKRAKLYALTD